MLRPERGNLQTKEKASVYIAIFTLNERDGWCAPGIIQFIVQCTTSPRKLCLHVENNKRHVDYARNLVVKDFLATDFEWLLMLDNDIAPPPNLLDMVDRAGDHMDILGPRYFLFAADLQKYAKIPGLPLVLGWQPLRDRVGDAEWVELAWSGGGVMFARRRVFEAMHPPWFRFEYDEDGQWINHEDRSFCQKARKAGFTVWGNTQFEADHFKTISLSALAKSTGAIMPSAVSELLARGMQ